MEQRRKDLEDEVGFPIIYLDEHICVINKPAGLKTIPGSQLEDRPASSALRSSTSSPPPSAINTSSTNAIPLKENAGSSRKDSSSSSPTSPPPIAATKKRTHQELWIDMLRDQESWKTALGEDQSDLKPYLERLSKTHAVPRKRRRFVGWALTALKTTEEKADELYSVLAENFEKREGPRADSVLTRMLRKLKEVKTVHRLDCETSGICVLALSVEAARHLTNQFKNKIVQKRYIAIVKGGPLPSAGGEITFPIRPDYDLRPKQVIDPVDGKESRTIYRTLLVDEEKGRSKVELIPYTGRTHQLRLHAAALNRPIVGDTIYSAKDKWIDTISYHLATGKESKVATGRIDGIGERLHLHAHTLSFHHPISNEPADFVTECPF